MASAYFFVLIAVCFGIYFNDEVKADCGKIIEETSGIITSPLYPLNYPPNQKCNWEIRMPPKNLIRIVFKHFDLEDSCRYDNLTVKGKLANGEIRNYGTFCGSEANPNNISESNILLIEFRSDDNSQYAGFEMEFSSISTECGGMHEESKIEIASPQFPRNYPGNSNCIWTIHAPLNHNIKLTFQEFTTETSRGCHRDYVTIESKMADGKIREYGKFCGLRDPFDIFSESNILSIQLVTNSRLDFRGFRAEISFTECGGLMEGSNGTIRTPFFPDSYPPNKMCGWTILVPTQHKIKLLFRNFEIEEGSDDCSNDFLLVQSRTADGEIHEYGKYCGSSGPPVIYSKNTILLAFVSDRTFQSKGFEAEYFIDKWTDYELSASLTKFTTTDYVANKSTTPTQYENSELGNVSSKNVANTLSDEFESTISPFMAPTTSFYVTNGSTADNQENESENWISRNETNILSDSLKLLTEKVASMEDSQKFLFRNYDNMLKISKLVTSKNAFLKGGGNSSSLVERQLVNDCGKFVFFLRRMLDSES